MLNEKKICILSVHYHPIYSSCSALIEDLAKDLVQKNFKVTVITPSNIVKKKYEITLEDGVEIIRVKTGNIKTNNNYYRFFVELTFPFIILFRLKSYFNNNNINLIICYSPSIFWYFLIKNIKKKSKVYLILRDIFPQWLIDSKIIRKNSLISIFYKYIEKKLYNISDRIGVQSVKNKGYFENEYKYLNQKIHVLYNWSSLKDFKENDSEAKYTSLTEKLNSKIVFVFGGVMGPAQDIPNIMRLYLSIHNLKDIFFLFMGSGSQINYIEKVFKEHKIKNYTILENVPQREYYYLLKFCNVGLVSLSDALKTHNFPGKILSYMSSSLPILGSINKGNDLKEIILSNECGLISNNGNDKEFVNNALYLYKNEIHRNVMAINSNKILLNQFTTSKASEKIIDIINE